MEYDFDIDRVDGIDELRDRMDEAETPEDWSYILSDYVSWGNSKIAKTVAIFNMNSATDCPNLGTEYCQVDAEECYAYNDENTYKQPLDYRRRQEYLWDNMSAELWADAFVQLARRKLNGVVAIRFSEAGDFRDDKDIEKVDEIAKRLKNDSKMTSIVKDTNSNYDELGVYTYSASSYLDWSKAKHFTVNQSNDIGDFGDRRYKAVPEDEEFPEDSIVCPYYEQKMAGDDDPIKCGECRLCIDKDAPDILIPLH